MDNGLSGRIARFNSADIELKANDSQVPVANVFTGEILLFRTPSCRGLWSPKILLSPAGPLWVMYAKNSARRPSWRAYGPLVNERTGSPQLVDFSAAGSGHPCLETLAVLLSKQLSVHVTVVSQDDVPETAVGNVRDILRRVIAVDPRNWHSMDRAGQRRLFYEFAEALRVSLLSVDAARKRDALVAAEYFYFSKPTEHILTIHAPLFKRGLEGWPAVLGTGGRADARTKEMACGLGVFVLERPKLGLPDTMQWRFAKFQEAVIQLGAT